MDDCEYSPAIEAILEEVCSSKFLGIYLDQGLTFISITPVFKRLQLLTLPLHFMFKCTLTNGRDVHSYETRGREYYRTRRHRKRERVYGELEDRTKKTYSRIEVGDEWSRRVLVFNSTILGGDSPEDPQITAKTSKDNETILEPKRSETIDCISYTRDNSSFVKLKSGKSKRLDCHLWSERLKRNCPYIYLQEDWSVHIVREVSQYLSVWSSWSSILQGHGQSAVYDTVTSIVQMLGGCPDALDVNCNLRHMKLSSVDYSVFFM
ncbi:hypothetical protein J6590_003701 [Homalodisca vitripennis]|nr:hypothetical protein J6590_003701 [Homalodisca vitripennis]